MPYVGETKFPITVAATSQLERNRLVKLTGLNAQYTAFGDFPTVDVHIGVTTAKGSAEDFAVSVFPLSKIDRTFFVKLGSPVALDGRIVPGDDGLGHGVGNDVENMDETNRPAGATAGQSYIVPAGGWVTGGATANQIATYDGATWSYVTPVAGDAIYNKDDGKFYVFNGSAWVETYHVGHACEAGVAGQDVAIYNW